MRRLRISSHKVEYICICTEYFIPHTQFDRGLSQAIKRLCSLIYKVIPKRLIWICFVERNENVPFVCRVFGLFVAGKFQFSFGHTMERCSMTHYLYSSCRLCNVYYLKANVERLRFNNKFVCDKYCFIDYTFKKDIVSHTQRWLRCSFRFPLCSKREDHISHSN